MGPLLKSFALAYGAGTLGGLANAAAVILFTKLKVFQLAHVSFGAHYSAPWLYNKLVWGGIWGAMLFLPLSGNAAGRGFIIGLGPSLVAGLLFLPKAGKGIFGIDLGLAMPVFVLLLNWIWGAVTVCAWKTFGSR